MMPVHWADRQSFPMCIVSLSTAMPPSATRQSASSMATSSRTTSDCLVATDPDEFHRVGHCHARFVHVDEEQAEVIVGPEREHEPK